MKRNEINKLMGAFLIQNAEDLIDGWIKGDACLFAEKLRNIRELLDATEKQFKDDVWQETLNNGRMI